MGDIVICSSSFVHGGFLLFYSFLFFLFFFFSMRLEADFISIMIHVGFEGTADFNQFVSKVSHASAIT